jgi:hypothetical protein
MNINYIVIPLLIISIIAGNYFSWKSYEYAKEQYKTKKFFYTSLLKGKEYYTNIGWKYKKFAFLTIFVGWTVAITLAILFS